MPDNPLLGLYAPIPQSDLPMGPHGVPRITIPATGPKQDGGGDNPLLGLYAAPQPQKPEANPLEQLYTPQTEARPEPMAAAKAIGQVVAPEITKAVTGEQAPPPQELPEQGKIPQVEQGAGPAVVEAAGMIPGPEVMLGGKAAALATAAAKQEDLFKGITALKNILSPSSTPLGKVAATGLRKATGQAAQTTEQTRAALQPFEQKIQALAPQQRLDLLGYMEGRSKGKTIPDLDLQEYANQFRNEMDSRKERIKLQGIEAGVIEDYVTHFWQDRNAAKEFVKGFQSKQGSGRSLKERTIPTIEEGIRAGLKPVSDNPTEIAMRYVTSMDRHLGLRAMLDAGEAAGHVQYFGLKDLRDVPDGWVALGGMADKLGSKAYAPKDWATIWNNFVSKGLLGDPNIGDAYDAFRNLSNLTTQTILSFSGYHAVTMAKEAIASDMVKGISEVVGGLRRLEADKVLSGVVSVATAPKAFIQKARTGKKLQEVYLGRTPNTIDPRDLPNWAKMADIYGEAGGRGVGKAHAFDYSFTPAGSFAAAWKKGYLKAEMRQAPGTFTSAFKEEAQKVWNAGGERGAAYKAGAKAMQTAKSTTNLISRAMSTVMGPLFEKYIPLLKNGAFADEFSSWLSMNPQAGHEEQVAFATKLIDSIDNRFGEMIQDNIMWHTSFKQIATVGMLSYSWNLGSFRLMAGGGKDILASKGRAFDPTSEHYSPNAAWIVAYPMAVAEAAALYQYLKTGKPPEKPMDLVFPQTGGTSPGFGQHGTVPQLGILPGYEKEPHGWVVNGIINEAMNKANPFARLLYSALMNKDWKGDDIIRPHPSTPEWLSDYFGYVLHSMVPITLGRMIQGEAPGSAMGLPEQLLGIRPAPIDIQDPEGYRKGMMGIEARRWKKKLDYDRKHNLFSRDPVKNEQKYQAEIEALKEKERKYGGPQQ